MPGYATRDEPAGKDMEIDPDWDSVVPVAEWPGGAIGCLEAGIILVSLVLLILGGLALYYR